MKYNKYEDKNNKLEQLSVEEFLKKCESEDFNVVKEWDMKKFRIFCYKCSSDDIVTMFREESGAMGSEYTGYMKGFNHDNGMVVKCKSCGNAMIIDLPDY
jgi:hypothetical protein